MDNQTLPPEPNDPAVVKYDGPKFAPEEIAEHLAELEHRAVEFSFGKTRFDYLYRSSAAIIRYLLSRDAAIAKATGAA